jgi:hypothetical protein
MNPDHLPLWFSAPTALVLWITWLRMELRDRRRRKSTIHRTEKGTRP